MMNSSKLIPAFTTLAAPGLYVRLTQKVADILGECYQGLLGSCTKNALPCRIVARSVKVFRLNRDEPELKRQSMDDVTEICDVHNNFDRIPVVTDYNCQFLLHHLRPANLSKRPPLVLNSHSTVLHDNARCHLVDNDTLLSRRWDWKILKHHPNSPNMITCDFDMLPKLNKTPSKYFFLNGLRINKKTFAGTLSLEAEDCRDLVLLKVPEPNYYSKDFLFASLSYGIRAYDFGIEKIYRLQPGSNPQLCAHEVVTLPVSTE
ncbi:hypothetical protein TNCV_1558411 [Trichonephila clavipes]|uniref:Uncharacterized protein n=1 Tax=Trichonephila clavipes TaxID=2585209 RepID=A0A8X6R5I8_TRICX|nr:hypothetical protein TNCV_1558411 [Trichonephila clavipes]